MTEWKAAELGMIPSGCEVGTLDYKCIESNSLR